MGNVEISTTPTNGRVAGKDIRFGTVFRHGTDMRGGREEPLWAMRSDYPASSNTHFWAIYLDSGRYVQCQMADTYEVPKKVRIEVEYQP